MRRKERRGPGMITLFVVFILPESEFGRADIATARLAAPGQIKEQTHRHKKKAVIRTGDKRRRDFIAGYLPTTMETCSFDYQGWNKLQSADEVGAALKSGNCKSSATITSSSACSHFHRTRLVPYSNDPWGFDQGNFSMIINSPKERYFTPIPY